MGKTEHDEWPGQSEQRILRQLDRMVATGRVTRDEAERLRSADGPEAFQTALGEVRVRHAGTPLDAAVAGGQFSQPEADQLLERVRRGDHSPELRKQLRQRHREHGGTAENP
jgi:hypothetical protein